MCNGFFHHHQVIRNIRIGNGFGKADNLQKWLSSAAGFIIVLLVSGCHILHPVFSVIIQICLLRFVPSSKVHWVSFFVGFAHLFHFRLCWNIPFIPSLGCAPDHTNAIQMIMTLKVWSLYLTMFLEHRNIQKTFQPYTSHPNTFSPTFSW